MDETIVTVYRRLTKDHRWSAEGILVDPDLRNRFLTDVRRALNRDLPEYPIRHRLYHLRGQKKLPRRREVVAG